MSGTMANDEDSSSKDGDNEVPGAHLDKSFTSNPSSLTASHVKTKKEKDSLLKPVEDITLHESFNISPPLEGNRVSSTSSSTQSFPTFREPTKPASRSGSIYSVEDNGCWESNIPGLPPRNSFGISCRNVSQASRRISGIMQMAVSKETIPAEDAKIARDLIGGFFAVLALVTYFLLKNADDDYESPLGFNVHTTFFISEAMILGSTRLSDASTYGERVLLVMVCGVIYLVSASMMFMYTSPCIHCVYFSTSSAVESSHFSVIEPHRGEWKFWHLLLGEDNVQVDDPPTVACRKCVSNLVTFVYGGWQSYAKKRIGLSMKSSHPRDIDEMAVPEQLLQDDAGDLAAWYVHYANEARSHDLKNFNAKLASALEDFGHLSGQELSGAMKEYLCSTASRFDNPDPVKYLADIKTGRFTGEKEATNLTTASLQRIMRGDILDELGVSVCFMLRFALFVPESHDLEITPISHTRISPIVNEDGLKAYDIRSEFPGIVLPQIDQDIDPTGDEILRFRKIMGVFTQLPFEDKTLYFDSKAEYLAFFRWELEKTIQDAFYFPRWLLEGPKGNQLSDMIAKKMKYFREQLILEDPNSDKTMSDRAFHGAGQYYLTPLRISGVDEDHDFFYPHKSKHFLSDEHRDKFRYTNMPSHKELLRMVKQMYPRKVKDTSTLLEWRDKILQIDFAALETLEPRENFFPFGATLYIDVKSRMPMGIWISGRKRLFLPNEGRDWEHAKFFWRVCERGAVTGRHVAENHFGYSHSGSTAAWQTLPPDHGLRILIKPFTLGVHSVNSAAYNMLIRRHSVLTHGASLTEEGLAKSFHVVYAQLNYSETIPDMLDSHDLDHILDTSTLPLWSQGKRLYDAHRKFVGNFVSFLYPTDEDMLKDDEVVRFWHHVNTQGRHTDPCVCGMDSDLFFDDSGEKWPAFETKHTCEELLDSAGFQPGMNMISRRRQWCDQVGTFDRIKALYKVIEEDCAEQKGCGMRYDVHMMRDNMGLKPLKTREQLCDFLATFIWHVSAGHEMNADNLSYFTDPEHSGVRLRDKDENGELPLRTDIGTYVFGLSIGSLTTVRSYPLLADWSPLYSHYVFRQQHLSNKERQQVLKTLNGIHTEYKHELVNLAVTFLDESTSRPVNRRWNQMNPATHTSSVAV